MESRTLDPLEEEEEEDPARTPAFATMTIPSDPIDGD